MDGDSDWRMGRRDWAGKLLADRRGGERDGRREGTAMIGGEVGGSLPGREGGEGGETQEGSAGACVKSGAGDGLRSPGRPWTAGVVPSPDLDEPWTEFDLPPGRRRGMRRGEDRRGKG